MGVTFRIPIIRDVESCPTLPVSCAVLSDISQVLTFTLVVSSMEVFVRSGYPVFYITAAYHIHSLQSVLDSDFPSQFLRTSILCSLIAA